eukprot:scaffold35119_cov56-Attheya_sp.AAC.1
MCATELPASEEHTLAELISYVMGFDPHHADQEMLMPADGEELSNIIPCCHPVWGRVPPVDVLLHPHGSHHSGESRVPGGSGRKRMAC